MDETHQNRTLVLNDSCSDFYGETLLGLYLLENIKKLNVSLSYEIQSLRQVTAHNLYQQSSYCLQKIDTRCQALFGRSA